MTRKVKIEMNPKWPVSPAIFGIKPSLFNPYAEVRSAQYAMAQGVVDPYVTQANMCSRDAVNDSYDQARRCARSAVR